jgi:hypothetical protein
LETVFGRLHCHLCGAGEGIEFGVVDGGRLYDLLVDELTRGGMAVFRSSASAIRTLGPSLSRVGSMPSSCGRGVEEFPVEGKGKSCKIEVEHLRCRLKVEQIRPEGRFFRAAVKSSYLSPPPPRRSHATLQGLAFASGRAVLLEIEGDRQDVDLVIEKWCKISVSCV